MDKNPEAAKNSGGMAAEELLRHASQLSSMGKVAGQDIVCKKPVGLARLQIQQRSDDKTESALKIVKERDNTNIIKFGEKVVAQAPKKDEPR